MGYTLLKAFGRGIDTRRMIDLIEPGGLLDAKDCVVTRGGEIEKRAAFVVEINLPPGTVGFHAMPGKRFHTFGDPPSMPPEEMEAGTVYHSIPDVRPITADHPAAQPLVYILQVEEFQTKLYVIAQYADGGLIHWWGGDDNGGADMTPICTYTGTGGDLIPDTPTDPPTPVDPPPTGQTGASPKATWSLYSPIPPSNAVDPTDPAWKIPGLQFCWLLKPGSKYKFSGSAIDAWSLINTTGVDSQGKPYTYVAIAGGAESNIALQISDEVNKGPVAAYGVKFNAQASGTTLSIYSSETSARFNGWTVQIGGRFQAYPDYKNTLSGGLDRVTSGVFRELKNVARSDGTDLDPLLLGTYACAHGQKMYTVNGSKLMFSAIHQPMRWDDAKDATGAGYIQMDMVAEGTPLLIALCDYQDALVLWGLRHVLIWHMEEDEAANYQKQILHHTGLVAPHAQVPYGAGECMYLDRSGIRSLRPRAAVDQAYASDLGIFIDSLVRAKIIATSDSVRFHKFWADVDPRSARLWMVLHDVAYVLSFYPSNDVSAWTWFDLTSCPVDYMNSTDEGIYWRSGDTVYSYGGDNGDIYDATECVARVPYVDGGKPATFKNWSAIDLAVYGTWQIRASFDPTQPTAFDLIANITKSTYAQQKLAMNGFSPAVSLEVRSSFVGPAKVGNAALHYEGSIED